MVKINYISDLHLEFYDDNVKFEEILQFDEDCEIICLCGDIGYPEHNNYLKLINFVSLKFKYVFVITGNHEYYNQNSNNKTIDSTHLLISKICNKFNNVYFLNNKMIYLKEFNMFVIGTTLWSYFDIDIINKKMFNYIYKTNDFNNIFYNRKEENSTKETSFYLDIDKRNQMFFESYNFIMNSLEYIKTNYDENNYPKVVIISHHLPTYQLMDIQYRFLKNSFIYATNLDEIFYKYRIDAWLCGHAHTHNEIYINNSYLGINAYGYPEKNKIPLFNKFIYI